MKPRYPLLAAAMAAGTLATAVHAGGVAASMYVGEPDSFGRIDIRGTPVPQLVQRRPVWPERPRGAFMRQPVYFHVPPGHQQNWRHYCLQYNACGEAALFVRDSWYQDSYLPHYSQAHGRKQ
jgi:hypothetical protein